MLPLRWRSPPRAARTDFAEHRDTELASATCAEKKLHVVSCDRHVKELYVYRTCSTHVTICGQHVVRRLLSMLLSC